jgi:DNA-binding LacI/PurR family transcriptional regulator
MSNPPPRATHRTIAKEAGVSGVTVSLALRNHPSIPESTRARIRKIADAQGYRPDPNVSKLMHHLRVRNRKNLSSNLVALRQRPEDSSHYHTRVLAGVQEGAKSLGFTLEVMDLKPPLLTRGTLGRVLRSRGVEGLILLPMKPVDLSDLLNWSDYSVVATSHSLLGPRVHTVVPNQFSNMLRLCEKLSAANENQIGIVLTTELDQRVNHRFVAAYLWHTMARGGKMIPPLLVKNDALTRDTLLEWIEQHDPKVVVTFRHVTESVIASLPASVRQRIKWACTGINAGAGNQWGISENPEEVGRSAVDVLAGMIQRGDRGIPVAARCTEIEGVVTVNPDGFAAQ